MGAQIQAIERSFYDMEHTYADLEGLKHPDPSKAHLKAVDVSRVGSHGGGIELSRISTLL